MLLPFLLLSLSNDVRVDPAGNAFVSPTGEQRFFHGVNYVRKGAPYIADVGAGCCAADDPTDCPATCPDSSRWTINDADVHAMREAHGVNVVRLGVMWPGAMPDGPGQVDATYLQAVRRVADLFWAYNISTILDFHQDVLSPRLCGEGAPLWVNATREALGGLPFPLPLGLRPVGNLPSGLPNCSAAPEPIGWSSYYFSDTCGRAFEALYTDAAPQHLGTQVALLWAAVAAAFAGHPGVLAYELLNEPWVGDSIEHPDYLLQPGKADAAQLAPFYARLHAAIRQHDNDTMLLYSGVEVGDRLTTAVGFEAGPGGHGYDAKQALVLHNYCAIGTDGKGPAGVPQRALCDVTDGKTFLARAKDAARLRTALFMTEFGATSGVPTGLKEIETVADDADAQSPPASWAYWCLDQWHPDPADARWGAISRPYAEQVDGTGVAFLVRERSFRLTFVTNKPGSAGAHQGTTRIFVPGGLAGADQVVVEPKGALVLLSSKEPRSWIELETVTGGVDVTVTINLRTRGKITL